MAAARIRILSTPFAETSTLKPLPLYAGQPISALLTINTSFRWGTSANDKERQYMLRYDVEELVKDWLVSGRKRGDFAATVWIVIATLFRPYLPCVCVCEGWRHVFSAYHVDRTTSRRTCSAQSVCGGTCSSGRVDDGCGGYSEH